MTVLLGAHWAGVPLAVGIFAAWCGWLAGYAQTMAVA